MRNLYMVTYDISDPKRLRSMFKTMRGFGDPLQYSVFVCELSEKEKAHLMDILDGLIHHTDDGVIIVNLGRVEGESVRRIEFLGKRSKLPERQAVII